MMIVTIAVAPPNTFSPKLPPLIAQLGHDELFLIELQGTLDVQGAESRAKDGQLIGTLNVADMNKPTLVIGHHLLEGQVIKLAKPLGVLHKHVSPTSDDNNDDSERQGGEKETGKEMGMGMGMGMGKEELKPGIRWDVTAVVKKKIVFAKRPMPITKPASSRK